MKRLSGYGIALCCVTACNSSITAVVAPTNARTAPWAVDSVVATKHVADSVAPPAIPDGIKP